MYLISMKSTMVCNELSKVRYSLKRAGKQQGSWEAERKLLPKLQVRRIPWYGCILLYYRLGYRQTLGS